MQKPDITMENLKTGELSQEASNYLHETGKCPVCDNKLVETGNSFVTAGTLNKGGFGKYTVPCIKHTVIDGYGCLNCDVKYILPEPILHSRELNG